MFSIRCSSMSFLYPSPVSQVSILLPDICLSLLYPPFLPLSVSLDALFHFTLSLDLIILSHSRSVCLSWPSFLFHALFVILDSFSLSLSLSLSLS